MRRLDAVGATGGGASELRVECSLRGGRYEQTSGTFGDETVLEGKCARVSPVEDDAGIERPWPSAFEGAQRRGRVGVAHAVAQLCVRGQGWSEAALTRPLTTHQRNINALAL